MVKYAYNVLFYQFHWFPGLRSTNFEQPYPPFLGRHGIAPFRRTKNLTVDFGSLLGIHTCVQILNRCRLSSVWGSHFALSMLNRQISAYGSS